MRLYSIMKAFPGVVPGPMIDDVPAKTWDWLLAIHNEVERGKVQVAAIPGR